MDEKKKKRSTRPKREKDPRLFDVDKYKNWLSGDGATRT